MASVLLHLSPYIRGLPLLLVAASLQVVYLLGRRRSPPKGLLFPPGPASKPLIGNLLDLPTTREWETYGNWADKYGELVYINIFGTGMLFLNSRKMVSELFEKRSSIYSDRTLTPMLDMLGFGWSLAFMRYGEWWRRHRRAMHEQFHLRTVSLFQPIQLKHTRELLRRLQVSPEEYPAHLTHHSVGLITEIGYGIRVLPTNDPYVEVAGRAMNALKEAGVPGKFLVDTLPWIQYIPKWFPGAQFRRNADIWRRYVDEMRSLPFQATKTAIASGAVQPCFAAALLEDLTLKKDTRPDEELVIENTAAALFVGGSDTTINTLKTFLLTMILFPRVQQKARQELDQVIGSLRLPEFDDLPNLPYIGAIAKEVLRWNSLAPLGLPHTTSEDDVVGEYFIPKGTLVFGNTWRILRDEATYGSHTEEFIPERFLQPGIGDPTPAFGYGRRVCPGRYLAENTILITIASILHVFELLPLHDSDGNDIPLVYEFTSGIFTYPTDFKCKIRPRSKTFKNLILQEFLEIHPNIL